MIMEIKDLRDFSVEARPSRSLPLQRKPDLALFDRPRLPRQYFLYATIYDYLRLSTIPRQGSNGSLASTPDFAWPGRFVLSRFPYSKEHGAEAPLQGIYYHI
jgi:hypothetical protein